MTVAVHHSLSASDFERAAHLVEQVGQELLMRSETVTLLKWLNVLPEELIQMRPLLCLFHAWTLILQRKVGKKGNEKEKGMILCSNHKPSEKEKIPCPRKL